MKNRGVSKSDVFELLELLEWSSYVLLPVYGTKNHVTHCYHCKGLKGIKSLKNLKSLNSMFLRGCLTLTEKRENRLGRIMLLDLYSDFNRLGMPWCRNQYGNTSKRQMKSITDAREQKPFFFENFKDEQVGLASWQWPH